MGLFSDCPNCGKQVEINKMPEAPGKSSQGGPGERLPDTSVKCPTCAHEFVPKVSYLKSA
jgi:endogenous inhibitor of DNA gyrase (YacG/DUF329 family)